MKRPSINSYYWIGAFLLLIAAVFSAGFYHVDEHFQIFEFAAFKLGLGPSETLPWEFHEKMRPSFQPLLVLGVYRLFEWLGMPSPFLTATLLRVLSACLSFGATILMLKSFKKELSSKFIETWVIPLSFFFWFQVYFGVRFSSENWGGALFALGLGLALTSSRPSFRGFFFTGLIFGLSFLCRFQIALMIAGCFLWFWLVSRVGMKPLLGLISGLGVAILMGVLMDYGFYGEWILTPWNYLYHNIVADKVNQFGISPWYFYVTKFFENGAPPLSLVVLFVFLLFPFRHPLHVLSFCMVPFFLVHQLIGHKEIRFLFPLVYFFPVMAGQIGEDFEKVVSRIPAVIFKGLIGINFFLLILILFRPADGHIPLFKTIYKRLEKDAPLYYLQENPYQIGHLPIYFYRPKDLKILPSSIEDFVTRDQAGSLIVTSQPISKDTFPGKLKLIFSNLPEWVLRFNINRWVEKTPVWWLYELSTSQ